MSKQKFTLDFTDILKDLTPGEMAHINSTLQAFLVERYSPIIKSLEELYKTNFQLDISDHRVESLARKIENFLKFSSIGKKIIPKTDKLEEELGNFSSSTITHMAFILQGLKHGKNLDNLINGYAHNSNHRAGLTERFQDCFIADFNRLHPKVMDGDTLLDEDVFASVRKYVTLRSIIADFNSLKPTINKNSEEMLSLREQIQDLLEELNNNPTLIPAIKKDGLGNHLQLILDAIDQGKNAEDIRRELLVKLSPETHTRSSYTDTLKSVLHLTDEQLGFLVSRYNQRSFVSIENALYDSLDAGKSGLRKEIFHASREDGTIRLRTVENQCISQQYLRDESGDIIVDEEDRGKTVKLHKITYIADLTTLTKSYDSNLYLPIQSAKEYMTCEALSTEGEQYEIPEVLKYRSKNNQILSRDTLSKEEAIAMLLVKDIEHELLPHNLKKLITKVSKYQVPIPSSIVECIIKNELSQINREQPGLQNTVFEDFINGIMIEEKELTKKVIKNLSTIFNNDSLARSDRFFSAVDDYIESKRKTSLTKSIEEISGRTILQTDNKENITIPSLTPVDSKRHLRAFFSRKQ